MVSGGLQRLLALFACLTWTIVHGKEWTVGMKRGASVVYDLDPKHFRTGEVDNAAATTAPDVVNRNLTSSDADSIGSILVDDAMTNIMTKPYPIGGAARVAYGTEAPKGALDFAVHLEVVAKDGIYTCGASLVDENWLVSAAHCVVDERGRTSAKSVTALVGTKDLRNANKRAMYSVRSLTVPSTFAPARTGNLKGDIALLYLDRPVKNIKPVAMANKNTDLQPWLVVAGWGLTETNSNTSPTLQYAAVPYLTVSQVKQLSQMTGSYFAMEDDKMAAGLGESDSCQGDSGGPLVVPSAREFTHSSSDETILVGVVSYGMSSRCQSGRNSVGFYTRLDPYENWIKSEIRSMRRKAKVAKAST